MLTSVFVEDWSKDAVGPLLFNDVLQSVASPGNEVRGGLNRNLSSHPLPWIFLVSFIGELDRD